MPWCPKCKLEYVAGKTVCPDCNSALVDDLKTLQEEELTGFDSEEIIPEEETEDSEFGSDPRVLAMAKALHDQGLSDDEIKEVFENLKNQNMHAKAPYKPVKDRYEENKSGASVLLICGIAGIVVLILNALGVIKLPITGFSLYLTYIVMGCLFLIFAISGITSIKRAKILKPMIAEEEEQVDKIISFLREKKNQGFFDLADTDISMEEASLYISNRAIMACEDEFKDLPAGLSFYVVDRYYEEIFENIEE